MVAAVVKVVLIIAHVYRQACYNELVSIYE